MVRFALKKGFMERNGIRASICDQSYFGAGSHPVMHFHSWDWQGYPDCVYPEIPAFRCNTPLEEYCVPPDAEYEIIGMLTGEIIVRIFAKQMKDTPVLEWAFPHPDTIADPIYKDFARGLW